MSRATHPAPASRRRDARALLRLGLPLIGSHLAQFAVQVTDTIMLGWYDVEALAAVVLGSTFFFVLFIVGSGFAWAVSPVVAAAAATGETKQVRRVTRMGMWLSILFAASMLPVLLFSAEILVALGQEPRIAASAGEYLRLVGWGLAPALIVMTLKSYLSALERVRIVLVVTVAVALLNVVLDYAFIFGRLGAPELGIAGAALASVTVHVISLVMLAIYAARATREHELFVRFWRPDPEAFGRIFRLGWPIGLTNLAEVGMFTATALMMGWIGTMQLAAHGIALQISSATFLVHVGLSNAVQVRAGAAFGRHDEAGLRRNGVAGIALSMVFALVTVAVFLGAPDLLVGMFLDPSDPVAPQVLAYGAVLLAYAAVFQLADAAQVMALGLLRGVQDTRVPMILAGISYWVVGMPAGYLLAFPLGLGGAGVWIGLILGLSCAGALLMWRFWQRSVHLRAV